MEFKGTKGKFFISNQNKEKLWFNVSSDKGVIARTFYGEAEPIVTSEEAKSNALLISKAPEMLEMLKLVVLELESGGKKHWEINTMVKQLIKEATEI